MSLDLDAMKRRSHIVIVISLLAGLCTAAGVYAYFKLHQPWALGVFAGSALVGFGCQIWFIAGLRGPKKGA